MVTAPGSSLFYDLLSCFSPDAVLEFQFVSSQVCSLGMLLLESRTLKTDGSNHWSESAMESLRLLTLNPCYPEFYL